MEGFQELNGAAGNAEENSGSTPVPNENVQPALEEATVIEKSSEEKEELTGAEEMAGEAATEAHAETQLENETVTTEPDERAESDEEPKPESESMSAGEEAVATDSAAIASQTTDITTDDSTSSHSTEELLKAIEELNCKMDRMNDLFTNRIQRSETEGKIIDQMHKELQDYKSNLYFNLIKPILQDIIEVRDSIRRMSDNYASKPEGERNIPLKTFSDYTYDLQDILEKNEVSIYDSKEGDECIPVKHKVIRKVSTPVEELNGKIAESLSSGYEYSGKTISPEKVVVYIYQKTNNVEGEQ